MHIMHNTECINLKIRAKIVKKEEITAIFYVKFSEDGVYYNNYASQLQMLHNRFKLFLND